MTTYQWNITEAIPYKLASSVGGGGGVFSVDSEQFDISIGDIPFLINAGADQPYRRATAQWQKDQFDTDRSVGEQSLTGWWLRWQADFSGGAGITYFEPLQADGTNTRFRRSSGVEVFDEPGEVTLLHEMGLEVEMGSSDVEGVAGPNRALLRNGSTLDVWDGEDDSSVTLDNDDTPASLAYTGSLFLIGHDAGIDTLSESSGTATSALWTGMSGDIQVWWAKQRIFAADGPDLYELTLAGGDMSNETPLYEHPDPGWTWTAVAETPGAVWAAGYSGSRSAVHVIAIDEAGETPALTAATVGIQLPDGERVNALYGYLGFLVVGTSHGLRVAATEGDVAALGPLLWDDDEVHSINAHGSFVYAGLSDGTTRKIDLGNEVGGQNTLRFAWANHLEADGDVKSLFFFDDELHIVGSGEGLYAPTDDLVEAGEIVMGYTRFGTLENKHFHNARIEGRAARGSIVILHEHDTHHPQSVKTLSNFSGVQEVSLSHPTPGVRFALSFTLLRGEGDHTDKGPTLLSYQLRAVPAPNRKQRLIQVPLKCFDREADRWGNLMGGPLFAYSRLRDLERAEEGATRMFRDFRTGEVRTVIIESVDFTATESPDRSEPNFEGTIMVTLRSLS